MSKNTRFRRRVSRAGGVKEDRVVSDFVLIAAGLAFFAAAILYEIACDRL